ncbi:hypothetical protein E4V01_15615 [Methylorubrum sp. Q1]|nr:hypothetical protein E4V01_15615 [Methylorubrum sp. Q1]
MDVVPPDYFWIFQSPVYFCNPSAEKQQALSDAQFRRLGSYDPKTDSTKAAQFRRIGQENLLTTLLLGR